MYNKQIIFKHIFLGFLLSIFIQLEAQEKLKYQKPPKHLADLFEAPETPRFSLNSDATKILLMQRPGMPSIEEVSQPEFRLAGLRINPRTNGPSRSYSYNKITVKDVKTLKEYSFKGLPEKVRIENISWSPDGNKIAFTLTKPDGYELWFASVIDYTAKKLSDLKLNDVFGGRPYQWISNSETILTKVIPDTRDEQPSQFMIPEGPVIQSNSGEKAPVRTYQDLLKNKKDEDMFRYFGTSELMLINLKGETHKLNKTGIFSSVSSSPDGQYILLTQIVEPFSYIVPYRRFAQKVEIINFEGKTIKLIADVPAAENLPKGFGAVRKGPRSFRWRNDVDATLYWIEALDEGDPNKKVDFREQLYNLEAPFNKEEKKSIKLKLRGGGITWGSDNLAMAYSWEWKTRTQITTGFAPAYPEKGSREIFNRSWEDTYNDPGNFETKKNKYGRDVLLTENKEQTLFLLGEGASPEGNRPFIDQFDLKTKKSKRLWQSKAPYYENAYTIIDAKKHIALTRKESKTETPNFYLIDYKKGKTIKRLTSFEHPYPSLKGITSEMIKYERKDGVKLMGKLYLPSGYDKTNDILQL